mmetsp:Transcript_6000/g.5414  ORF Transcript_6000/g.5414 Transcript_6000/m.5414 type:complete len:92 (-) Transcript_6000:140-415(-)
MDNVAQVSKMVWSNASHFDKRNSAGNKNTFQKKSVNTSYENGGMYFPKKEVTVESIDVQQIQRMRSKMDNYNSALNNIRYARYKTSVDELN